MKKPAKKWGISEMTKRRCTEICFDNLRRYQCNCIAIHDPDEHGNPTKCGRHSAAKKAARKDKREAKYAAHVAERQQRERIHAIRAELDGMVEAIAAGHNNPAELCRDWLKRLKEAKEK